MKQNYAAIKKGFTLLLLLFAHSFVIAQQVSSAVRGVVKNQRDENLQGVTVTIKNKDSAVVATSVTNGSGVFNVSNLQTGNPYTLIFSHVGYEPYVVNNYNYSGEELFNLSFRLSG